MKVNVLQGAYSYDDIINLTFDTFDTILINDPKVPYYNLEKIPFDKIESFYKKHL